MTKTCQTEYPLEIHVLASLQAKMPLYVGNARGFWLVDGEDVTYFGPLDKK